MKTRFLLSLLLVVALAGMTELVGQNRLGDKTVVTGAEIFDPLGLIGPPVGEIVSPGTLLCPGYEPTGDPLQPCPTGSLIHIRDFKTVSRVNSSQELAGWMTVVANANWDAAGTGPAWGTFSLALDAGGTWEGTWEGLRVQDGSTWINPLHVSGQGTGGAIDGMHIRGVDRIVEFTPVAMFYFGSLEVLISDPRAK